LGCYVKSAIYPRSILRVSGKDGNLSADDGAALVVRKPFQ
jgi:hypothetical protein